MCKRHMTTLLIVASLLISAQALAQSRPPTIPNFQRGQALTADELNRMVGQINKNTNALSEGNGETHTMDCASGETIQAAMAQAQPGDTIMISGTCNEAVVVNIDGITLDGQGSAVIDGMNADTAALLIKGRRNVTVRGLTVQNGLNNIKIVETGAAWLKDVTVQNSRLIALFVWLSGMPAIGKQALEQSIRSTPIPSPLEGEG